MHTTSTVDEELDCGPPPVEEPKDPGAKALEEIDRALDGIKEIVGVLAENRLDVARAAERRIEDPEVGTSNVPVEANYQTRIRDAFEELCDPGAQSLCVVEGWGRPGTLGGAPPEDGRGEAPHDRGTREDQPDEERDEHGPAA